MAELMNCPECGEPLKDEKATSPVGDIPIKVCHQCKKWWGDIQSESKSRQLKMRLWDLWKKEDTLNKEYSVIDVHIEKRLLMGRVAAMIDEMLGLQFSDVAGLPLGGFER